MAHALEPMDQNPVPLPTSRRNVLPFPMAKMPCMHTLAEYIAPVKPETPIQRDIALTLASYNLGAVAETSYTNGVIALARKAYMLAEGFK